MEIIIREEAPMDYAKIRQLVTDAFSGAEHTDGDEQNLVERIRQDDSYIPKLSLVALNGDEIVGHIMFSKLSLGDTTQLAVAPLAVAPHMQGKGIGGMLLKKGEEIAKDLGYDYAILLGHETYYPRFGYKKACDYGIEAPFDVPSENFMALNLQGKDKKINAKVVYAPPFGI